MCISPWTLGCFLLLWKHGCSSCWNTQTLPLALEHHIFEIMSSPALSPRFCQSSFHAPTLQTSNFRATFGVPCPFLLHVQLGPDESPLETSLPAFSIPFGFYCPTAPKFVEYFFWARPYAKHFLHIITFNPHRNLMRKVILTPLYRWENKSILLYVQIAVLFSSVPCKCPRSSHLWVIVSCTLCASLFSLSIEILLVSPGQPWLPQLEVISL